MITTLPALDGEYHVPADAVSEFREKGHTVLRGVATAEEIAAWGPFIEEVTFEHAATAPKDYGERLTQVQNLWCRDDRVKPFSLSPRFARIAADLLGVDAVRMYHDQAIFKQSGDTKTPFHQDHYYFPLERDDALTMWMPLVPITAEMGSMTFASGSHRFGYLGEYEISDEADQALADFIEKNGLTLETHGVMAPGDATFHRSSTLHAAPANTTDDLRAVMTVIWFADGLRGIEPEHDWHRKDYDKWLPGVQAGELAASPLNPVCWRRDP